LAAVIKEFEFDGISLIIIGLLLLLIYEKMLKVRHPAVITSRCKCALCVLFVNFRYYFSFIIRYEISAGDAWFIGQLLTFTVEHWKHSALWNPR